MFKIAAALPFFTAIFASLANALPLTIVVPAHERACFYVQAHDVGAQIGASFFVMAGGQFDIDATLKRPDGTIVQDVQKSNGDEFAFRANIVGEYELCFYNEMSTFAEKKIEFDFDIETKYLQAELPPMVGESNTEGLERHVNALESRVSELVRSLQYYKGRNSRNQDTVKSTEGRIFWFCILQLVLVVVLAGINVSIVQFFFKGSRKTLV